MGAWGVGSFENDDAGDWVWELEEAGDGSFLVDTLQPVADAAADKYVEVGEAACALAAAEVVAAALGQPGDDLPASVTDPRRAHARARALAHLRRAYGMLSGTGAIWPRISPRGFRRVWMLT